MSVVGLAKLSLPLSLGATKIRGIIFRVPSTEIFRVPFAPSLHPNITSVFLLAYHKVYTNGNTKFNIA